MKNVLRWVALLPAVAITNAVANEIIVFIMKLLFTIEGEYELSSVMTIFYMTWGSSLMWPFIISFILCVAKMMAVVALIMYIAPKKKKQTANVFFWLWVIGALSNYGALSYAKYKGLVAGNEILLWAVGTLSLLIITKLHIAEKSKLLEKQNIACEEQDVSNEEESKNE